MTKEETLKRLRKGVLAFLTAMALIAILLASEFAASIIGYEMVGDEVGGYVRPGIVIATIVSVFGMFTYGELGKNG